MLHRRLAGVAILVVACNGDPSIHELFSDEVSTVCGRVFDCESQYDPSMHGGEPFSQFAGGTDVNGCETMLDGLLGSAADTAQTEVDAGRVRYDASEGKACIDGFGAATCDEVLQQNGAQFPLPPRARTRSSGSSPTAARAWSARTARTKTTASARR